MKKYILLWSLFSNYLIATVYSVDTATAINAIKQTNDYIFVFVNIDPQPLRPLYEHNYKEVLKKARLLSKEKKREGNEMSNFVNNIMKMVDSFYIASFFHASHVLGVTRRSLAWSHLIRSRCYDAGVMHPATRYHFLLNPETATEEDHHVVECNTGILYIDSNNAADSIAQYVHDCGVPCHGIIYVDADKQSAEQCIEQLTQKAPHLKCIGLHVYDTLIGIELPAIPQFLYGRM